MKNKKLIILSCLLVLGFGLGLTAYLLSSDEDSKLLELTYQTNGGVPFEWKYEIKDKDIVKFVKKYEISKEKEPVEGGEVDINYVFKGLKKGKTTITFKYVSIEGEVVKEEKNIIKVDENKNISLVMVN